MSILWELAERYTRDTEEYDRTVCTGTKDGIAMPETGKQLALIGQHAKSLNDKFLLMLTSMGYSKSDWSRARNYATRQLKSENLMQDKQCRCTATENRVPFISAFTCVKPACIQPPCLPRPIYVVSDLHAGDRGPRDSFAYGNREKEFSDFLDFVTKNNGQLVIAGDLLDCWQFNVSKVLTVRLPLLDRLASMNAAYIIGNHDADLNYFLGTNLLNHSLIRNAKREYSLHVGGRLIRIIHGHEADPYCVSDVPGIGRITAIMSGIAEDRHGGPMASKYKTIAQKVVAPMDRAVSHINWLRGKPSREKQMNRALKVIGYNTSNVLISGHTHKAGHIGDWYYNSGTWAEFRNSFLVINPGGTVGVFDWVAGRPVPNDTVLPI